MSTEARRRSAPVVEAPVVPPAGDDRRVWIRYQLQQQTNPATGRRYTQSDVAREAGVTEPTVSLIYNGSRTVRGSERGVGKKKTPRFEKVIRITARILGMTTDELFGVWLEAGDGYPGSPGPRPSDDVET